MTLDDLHQHPLSTEAVQDCIAVHKALGLTLTEELDEDTAFDELQFYITGVGFSVTHTLAWVEQLHQAVHFMTDFHYGKKATDSLRYDHSGRPGGLRVTSIGEMLAKNPRRAVERAVWGMMPKNKLSRQQLKKLKVYGGPEHPHAAQNPQPYEITQIAQ